MIDTRNHLWTGNEVAAATGGRAAVAFEATGVSIDSRTVAPGDLFVAIAGPNHDGHDHVANALARGAAGALVHRRPDGLAADAPLVEVADTFEALNALAGRARARTSARIAAVTGSVGKTGTKEALRGVLGRQGRTEASHGNLNNHWGLPLSLARLSPDARYGVFEMGMNHAGEIEPLSRLARPHVAVVTTVAAVHAGHFRDEEAIADAKAEIFAGLGTEGTAVLNRDNRHFDRLRRAAEGYGVGRVIAFGTGPAAEVRLLSAEAGPEGTDIRADVLGHDVACRIGIAGPHWVSNGLSVLACAAALGADVADAAQALASLEAPAGRGNRLHLPCAGGTVTVIDESYNASPVSMAAALDVLGGMTPGAGGRRIAVLGDMLELGEAAAGHHRALADPIAAAAVDLVFTAGPLMAGLSADLPTERRGGHADSGVTLAPIVAATVRPGDVVMVKGSNGIRMDRVVEALKSLADAAEPAQRLAECG